MQARPERVAAHPVEEQYEQQKRPGMRGAKPLDSENEGPVTWMQAAPTVARRHSLFLVADFGDRDGGGIFASTPIRTLAACTSGVFESTPIRTSLRRTYRGAAVGQMPAMPLQRCQRSAGAAGAAATAMPRPHRCRSW